MKQLLLIGDIHRISTQIQYCNLFDSHMLPTDVNEICKVVLRYGTPHAIA